MNAQSFDNTAASDRTPADSGHHEEHFVTRSGWLRAAVLGANDGLLSTGSLMAGVAAAAVAPGQLVLTGVAGIVAGALSMAAGEYVSVSSQADSEKADLEREAAALRTHPKQELTELAAIYRDRGLDEALAHQVATQLHDNDALDAHKRDELGLHEGNEANPMAPAPGTTARHRIDRDDHVMTRHGSASPRSESLVLLAAIPLALATRPIAPATVSSPDPGQHLRRTLPPGAVFQPNDAHHSSRCARLTTQRKPKNP